MAAAYVERLRDLLAPTITALPSGVTVDIRHFFSGAAAYANDRICISLSLVGLAMKLPEDGRAKLMALGAYPSYQGAMIKTHRDGFPRFSARRARRRDALGIVRRAERRPPRLLLAKASRSRLRSRPLTPGLA